MRMFAARWKCLGEWRSFREGKWSVWRTGGHEAYTLQRQDHEDIMDDYFTFDERPSLESVGLALLAGAQWGDEGKTSGIELKWERATKVKRYSRWNVVDAYEIPLEVTT